MQGAYFSYGLLAALAIVLVVAAVTDLRRRQIDHWVVVSIAITAPLFWWATGLSLWPGVAWQLGVAVASFALGAGLNALGQMGGGDVKLLTALALWMQPLWFIQLFVVMALIGGLLTIVTAIHHFASKKPGRVKVPYGIAIAAAGLWTIGALYSPAVSAGANLG